MDKNINAENASLKDSEQIKEENFVEKFKSEIRELSHKELQNLVKQFNFVCLNYDPYTPHITSQEVEAILLKFNLDHLTQNPFTLTNTLLQLLSLTEDEIKTRIH